jgi:hypothetical protein
VATSNIGRTFLKLINKHFPKRSKLHKIFNQNNVKVSYSCMRSMGSIIRTHNSCIRRKENHEAPKKECNCRAKGSCPLRGKCLTESIVYKATVKSGETSKFYVGLSGGKFKDRYNNHTKSLKHKKYEKETELSKYVWALKQKNSEYTITWDILHKSNTLKRQSGNCNLCIEEKLAILMAKKIHTNNCLNKRTELVSKCRHGYKPPDRSRKK